MKKTFLLLPAMLLTMLLSTGVAGAGPYSGASSDPGTIDAGIPGWVGADGDGSMGGNNVSNPIFAGWATGYQNYLPSASINSPHDDPTMALGAVPDTGNNVVSLGDMNQTQIDSWLANPDPLINQAPGEITLTFDNAIYNGSGADFAIFENSFISTWGESAGYTFAELGYVEVSTDGVNFTRFASDSQIEDPFPLGQPYGTIDSTDVYNLAGKHVNNYGESWGTPFDLDTLLNNDLVISGLVDLSDINYVRIIDIPGTGDFMDSEGDGIMDAWETWGTGGFDLDAVGVINAVPVPAGVWLLGSGLLGLISIRRQRR